MPWCDGPSALLDHHNTEPAAGVAEQLLSGARERKLDEMSKCKKSEPPQFLRTAHLDASGRESGWNRRGNQKPKKSCRENEPHYGL
jgi:hypothetical protein